MRYADDREPWARQPDERDRAFLGFQLFCYGALPGDEQPRSDFIPTQSWVATRLGVNRDTVSDWSVKNDWRNRRDAWKSEQDRVHRQALLDELQKMGTRHATLAAEALGQILKPLAALGKPRSLLDSHGFPVTHNAHSGACPGCSDRPCKRPELDGKAVMVDRDTELSALPTAGLLMLVRSMSHALPPLAELERFSRGQPQPEPASSGMGGIDPDSDEAVIHFADVVAGLAEVGVLKGLPSHVPDPQTNGSHVHVEEGPRPEPL
jgi:hypothetical protein